MALIKCKECGKEVSDNAKSCPHCGAPPSKKTGCLTWVIAIFFAFVVFSSITNLSKESTQTNKTQSPPTPTVDKSPEKQAQRKQLLEKLIAQGVFLKIDTMGGTLPKAYVTPAFYALDIDMKKTFVSVIYAYYFDGNGIGDTVILRDSKTGKQIGTFSKLGLKLD